MIRPTEFVFNPASSTTCPSANPSASLLSPLTCSVLRRAQMLLHARRGIRRDIPPVFLDHARIRRTLHPDIAGMIYRYKKVTANDFLKDNASASSAKRFSVSRCLLAESQLFSSGSGDSQHKEGHVVELKNSVILLCQAKHKNAGLMWSF